MKNRIIAITIILLALSASAAGQTTKDAAELDRMLREFLVGASTNDVAIHDRFWAEDLIYTRSAGVRINKAELMKGVRGAPPRKPGDPAAVYTAEDVRIQQYGSAAVVAFRLVATIGTGSDAKVSNYLNTGTFIKRNKKWQAVAWQSTAVPKPADSPKPAN